jgi:hypothetical protein
MRGLLRTIFSILAPIAIICGGMYASNLGVRVKTKPVTCLYWTPFRVVELPRLTRPSPSLNSLAEHEMWEIQAPCPVIKNLSTPIKP